MEPTKAGIAEIISTYKEDVEALIKYLPWLESKKGAQAYSSYVPEQAGEYALKVPVYDSTLLSFVKVANNTKFINRNYVYTYSRKRIKDASDEHRVIDNTQIMDMKVLGDILSKYILKGVTKGVVWSEGVSNGVLYHVVSQMKSLIEFWTVPM